MRSEPRSASTWRADHERAVPATGPAELTPPAGRLRFPRLGSLDPARDVGVVSFTATAPVDVTVGAFRGKEIELTALDSGGDCPEVIAFSFANDTTDISAGDTLRVQIVDVDGVRIVMSRSKWVDTREPVERDAAAEAELQQILDSIRIEPLP